MYECNFEWIIVLILEKILNCMGIYIVGERTGKMYTKCDY